MNSVEQAASRLAAAEHAFDLLKRHVADWPENLDLNVDIGWAWAGSLPGHKELVLAVRKRLQADMHKHVAAAVEEARQEMHEARRNMSRVLESIWA